MLKFVVDTSMLARQHPELGRVPLIRWIRHYAHSQNLICDVRGYQSSSWALPVGSTQSARRQEPYPWNLS